MRLGGAGVRWRSLRAAPEKSGRTSDLPGFVVAAAIVGALTGLVAASFRSLLSGADRLRTDIATWAHGSWWGAVVVIVSCAACAGAAAALVRRVEPAAEGSGIPHVEAVVEGRTSPGRLRLLPVKYVGGLLSLGSGMALGREGPSVQMGGSIAVLIAKLTRRSAADLRLLAAGGAAAGLATAFNAPIAGGVFVLEELVKRFDTRAGVATLVASASGFAAAHVVVPSRTEFRVGHLHDPSLSNAPWVLAVGVLAGVLGVLYSKSIVIGLRRADTGRLPAELRAMIVGAGIGVVVWLAPQFAGSGNELTQRALLGHGTLLVVIGVLVLRFVLGVASYVAATPGGLFAPMLTLGADCGLVVALLAGHVAGSDAPTPAALALIGMAAFFTAVVQAPVTGLILATELTGSTSQLPPMLGACAIALIVALTAGCRPIYDLLTDRASRDGG